MADNTILNPGVGGDTISTDDIGGSVKVQRVKIQIGADGAATDVSSANALPVSDNGGSLTVDGSVSLAAAVPAGTNNIGDVDVLTEPSSAADGGALPAVQKIIGGYDGTNTQVITTDASGRLVIVDGGGSLTVDGTVTANAGTGPWPVTDNGGSLTVDGSVVVSAGSITVNGAVTTQANGTAATAYTPQMYAAQTTTVRTVKGTGGVFAGYIVYNPNAAAIAYVQLFNVATATTVTLGTTVPDMILPIPPASAANVMSDVGIGFSLGIKLACTTTATGSTAPASGLDMTVYYK